VDSSGKVVVEFRLHPDGRVTDLNIVQNEMSDLFGLICAQAIRQLAPCRTWPLEMRRDIPKEYRDVTFTFYYGMAVKSKKESGSTSGCFSDFLILKS